MAKRPGTVSPTAIRDFGLDLNSSADTMNQRADGTATGADLALSLEEILSLYGQPINEEQAWAVCYQCCRSLQNRHRRTTTSKTPAAHSAQGSVIVDHHHQHDAIWKIEGPENVRIRRDGTLVVHHQHDTDKYRAAHTSLQVIESLGIMIYKALDYGLKENEERELSPPLEHLIDLMTNSTETQCDDPCPDEGYEATEEEEDEGEGDEGPAAIVPGTAVSSVRSYRDIMAICSSHLPSPSDAPKHYQAVCRALYAETKELRTFLDKIRSAKEDLRKMEVRTRGDPVQDLDELQNADWACFWVQVMRDLRDGVKLKKVQERQYNPLPIEYQLTPYEMLMDDIRSQRYKLRKVMVQGGIPPRLKRSAHEVILDFIRSRPPLNPASARKLKPRVPRPASLHERLLEGIHAERKLRTVSPDTIRRHRLGAGKSISTPQDLFRGSDSPDAPRKLAGSTQSLGTALAPGQGGAQPLTQRKRLLKAPTLAELDSSDSDEDATQSSSSASTSMVEETSPESVMSRKGRPNFLPISSTPEPVERHAHQRRHSIEKETPTSVRLFVPPSRQSSKSLIFWEKTCLEMKIQWQAAISVGQLLEVYKKIRSTSSQCVALWNGYFRRVKNVDATALVVTLQQAEPPIKVDMVSSDQGGEEFSYPVECLALTVEEVMHIRQVLVKAELEKFQQYKDIYTALKKGKLCFSCRTKKFSLFTWAYICQFCKRPVCSQCCKKMRLPSKPYSSLPIYSLGASAMSKEEDGMSSAIAQADKTPFGSGHNRHSLRKTVSKMSKHSGGTEGLSRDEPELPKELTEDWATMDVCVDCKKFITEIISSSKRSLSVATKRARLNRNRKTQSFYLASSSNSLNFRLSERTINEV